MQRSKPTSGLAVYGGQARQRSDRDAERAELEREATRLIRAADRKRRAVQKSPPPAAPPLDPQHLTLADLGWLRKMGRVP
jgi:hypothetical protein